MKLWYCLRIAQLVSSRFVVDDTLGELRATVRRLFRMPFEHAVICQLPAASRDGLTGERDVEGDRVCAGPVVRREREKNGSIAGRDPVYLVMDRHYPRFEGPYLIPFVCDTSEGDTGIV